MPKLKILVIGGGGREHTLAWRLAQSPSVEQLFATPGNPGIAKVAKCLPAGTGTPDDYLALAESVGADLTVVGPEAPLVAGIADAFLSRNRRIVGPTAAAARLEGSKSFAKNFMAQSNIPTATFHAVDTEEAALHALDRFTYPVVLKADGLAAGKGVVIAKDRSEAEKVAHSMLAGEYVGNAGRRLVIEEFLQGEEVSFMVLTDGHNVLPLEPTQDHKAVFDGDTGPNTGGMGAYCDSRILNPDQTRQILDEAVYPTITGMSAAGCPFTGFLYLGLMMTDAGPKVLEYNVRLGDPETQCLLHRLNCDFASVLFACASGDLAGASLAWRADPSVCVVLASAGYPGPPQTGLPISGIEKAEAAGATVFHAGTSLKENVLVSSGGRVLGVTASGATLASAIGNAYQAVSEIRLDGMHYRKDIGQKGLRRW
jgi:phosphoribosylamine--glycine ligase